MQLNGFGPDGDDDALDADVEGARGGRADDSLVGNTFDNVLDGGAGRDAFFASAGDDVIVSRDGIAEDVSCGTGIDRAVIDLLDRPSGCEERLQSAKEHRDDVHVARRVHMVRGGVGVGLFCPRAAGGACRGRLALRRGGHELGTSRYGVAPGRSRRFRIPVAGRDPTGIVEVVALARDTRGRPRTSTARRVVARR